MAENNRENLSKKILTIHQVVKYFISGLLSAAIDIGILNFLSAILQVREGLMIIPINIIGFTIATLNSYFWNKHWTFNDSVEKIRMKQLSSFFIVAGLGALINSGILYILLTFVPVIILDDQVIWFNIAKIIATAVSVVWNFIGYKVFVFKK